MLSCTPTAAWLVSSVTLTNEAVGRALGAGEAGPRAITVAAMRNLQCGMAVGVCGGEWQKRTEREREERERKRDCGDA